MRKKGLLYLHVIWVVSVLVVWVYFFLPLGPWTGPILWLLLSLNLYFTFVHGFTSLIFLLWSLCLIKCSLSVGEECFCSKWIQYTVYNHLSYLSIHFHQTHLMQFKWLWLYLRHDLYEFCLTKCHSCMLWVKSSLSTRVQMLYVHNNQLCVLHFVSYRTTLQLD